MKICVVLTFGLSFALSFALSLALAVFGFWPKIAITLGILQSVGSFIIHVFGRGGCGLDTPLSLF